MKNIYGNIFVRNELLFKTDNNLIDRFISPAPFSKFYLEIDNESPGKIGQWIGWQILRSFRKKNPSFKYCRNLETIF